jgi:DNA mismatch repair protein MutL
MSQRRDQRLGNIKILDEHIANQIAAGEVVERPASIVKELIENALDARSTRIEIEVQEGGLSIIRIQDDGAGMDPDDVVISFSRHATSKIAASKDLFHIRTLGFRGEALPSIAAVAKVECRSATADGIGTYLRIEGGQVLENKPCASPRGTEMTIRQLFYNTPARLKYMKSVQTEFGHITDVVYRAALARPDVAFVYKHDQRTVLQTNGNGDLKQVIAAIYGSSMAKGMIKVSAENLDFRLDGYVSKPEFTRSSRSHINWFVNSRSIRNPALFHSLMQSYHTLLPLHRYPLAVLNIDMDPILMDVNVHPAKLEVRLSKEQECCQFLQNAIKEALQREILIPRPQLPGAKVQKQVVHQQQIELYKPADLQEHTAATTQKQTPSPAASVSEGRLSYGTIQPTSTDDWAPPIEAQPEKTPTTEDPKVPRFHPLGQVHGTYILAQSEEGLYIVDQHAAHERIYYERFYEKMGAPVKESQQLIVPLVLEWTAKERDEIQKNLPSLEDVGVYMESFGGNTFIIRSIPTWFPKGEEQAIIEEMVDYLLTQKRVIPVAKWREKSAIMLSCKSAIKANKRLSFEEMDQLLAQLRQCKQPYTCPHGRPIIIHFSTYDLEKMFKRVM